MVKNSEESEETKAIYVQVSKDARDIIDKYKEKDGYTISKIIEDAIKIYDNYHSMSPETMGLIDKYKEIFETEPKIFEEAIKLLDVKENPSNETELWCRMKEEMNMMSIGKTTFNQLLSAAESKEKGLDRPISKNIAFDVILWYTGKPIKNLTIEEIIDTIKIVWKAANHFYSIDVNKESEDMYHLIFRHHQNKRYSNYFLGYFTELLASDDLSFKCLVEGEALDESISLTIKKVYRK